MTRKQKARCKELANKKVDGAWGNKVYAYNEQSFTEGFKAGLADCVERERMLLDHLRWMKTYKEQNKLHLSFTILEELIAKLRGEVR